MLTRMVPKAEIAIADRRISKLSDSFGHVCD
jgi:hypothetical protein